MRKTSDYVAAMEEHFSLGARRGAVFLSLEDEALTGRTVRLSGRDMIHFGSCSYMGLELDERLKAGAIDAITRYGTQFSSSRGYLSLTLYEELEQALETIFGAPALVTPSTTLAHASALPVLIDERDAVLLDQQVHASVQMAVNHVRVMGVPVAIVRHNRLDLLEERLEALSRTHRRIWYMADGVYSMVGDRVPLPELKALLDRHEQLWVYLDDAHAMSWCGERGRGHALGALAGHPRVVVATSLNKAFGAAGGALVLPDDALKSRIRTVGMPLIFSGPVQPPMLGAAIASAKLHLEPAFPALQAELADRIALCNALCLEKGLPLVGVDATPIFFIGAVETRAAYGLVGRLMAEGYYANPSIFPVVPMRRSGLRFTLTRHHSVADIRGFIDAVAAHLPEALAEEDLTVADVRRIFKLHAPEAAASAPRELTLTVSAAAPLRLQHETTHAALDRAEWDALLGDRGTFDWEGLRLLERVFADQRTPEQAWKFHYFLVRDATDRPVLATFFTEALWKDDMLAPAEVSRRLEAQRADDPLAMTTRVVAMGALLTEGDHMYLDREADWRGALALVLASAGRLAEAAGAPMVALRDLPAGDDELSAFLTDRGFVRFPMLEGFSLEDMTWEDEAAFHAGLSFKSRRHRMSEVVPWNEAYDLEILQAGEPRPRALTEHLYGLYRQVQARSLDLNTFPLPLALFEAMAEAPGWEWLMLHLKPSHGGEAGARPVAFAACYRGRDHYVPHVCGLDDGYRLTHGAYRQLLRHCVLRARALGVSRLELGLGAALEKRRLGARAKRHEVYVQNADAYQIEVLAELMGEVRRSGQA